MSRLSSALYAGLLVLASAPTTSAQFLKSNQFCFDAIQEAYSSVLFADADPLADYYAGLCTDELRVTSIYGAASTYCTIDEFNAGYNLAVTVCTSENYTLIPPTNFQLDHAADVGNWPLLNRDDYDKVSNFSEPILIDEAWYLAYRRTVETWDYESKSHRNYGWAIFGFWGFILIVGMVSNVYGRIGGQRYITQSDVEGSEARPTSGRVRAWLDTNVVLSPLFGRKHRQLLLWCQVPTRLEGFVIYSYWFISLVLCCVNYRTFEGNLYWPETDVQGWRYIADRTGVAAYANLPWLWLFAGRNNVFLWATGWSFSTFNLFHKHIARVATIEAIVHSIAYTVLSLKDGSYAAYWTESWWNLGVVGTIAMSLILVLSSVLLRRRSYEIFLVLHILMSILVLYSLFVHTSIFDGIYSYNGYLWAPVALWTFDRFMRIVRLVTCNIGFLRKGSGLAVTRSEVTYDADADIVKITIVPPPGSMMQHMTVGPGQYFYLYRPFSWKGWENHPFSLGAYGRVQKSCLPQSPISPSDKAGSTVDVVSTDTDSQNPRDNELLVNGQASSRTLTFWVKPFGGWTGRLAKQCQAQASEKRFLPKLWTSGICLEGPYHNHHGNLLRDNDQLLLIAGGTGIAAILPWVHEFVAASQSKPTIRVRHIHLVWANRGQKFLASLLTDELACATDRADIQLDLYDTSCNASSGKQPATGAHITPGRPDITQVILQAASEACGQMSVMLCGPAGMADEARNAVLQARCSGASNVNYAEEVFGW